MKNCIVTQFGSSETTLQTPPKSQRSSSFMKNAINGRGFDLIALDINMPQMDGNELASKIRETGYEGKIVALTADVTGDGRIKSKSSGIDFYMGKMQAKKDVLSALLGA